MSKIKGDPGYRGGWCVHYCAPPRGFTAAPHICVAGLEVPKGPNAPCFLDNGQSRLGAKHCDKLRRPTSEEIATHEEWSKQRMEVFGQVMTGILPWRNANKGKSAREVVECPACKGRLHLSIAAYNGHVHGCCETQGCVSWME